MGERVGGNGMHGMYPRYLLGRDQTMERESAVCRARLQNSRLNYEVWYKNMPGWGKGWGKWNAWNVSTSSIGRDQTMERPLVFTSNGVRILLTIQCAKQ
ncbi:hypothetical protein CEXT_764011 [Caerostris extrusa]|uniref:Uncharacterized protein n=1 Tax=Caerostris extrusa TaxID=172846 RepID=A0AAV4YBA4_CAEEX|nr:hypothetical protein CEXT_764011 [Caerostris extrusa]